MNKIKLRPLMPDDAAVSFRWRNDSYVWRYTYSRPDHEITEAEERKWIESVTRDSSRLNFAILLGEQYIGNVYLVNIIGDTSAMGVFIGDRAYLGHGYGRDAINLLKREAKKRGIRKIIIHCSPDNIPAIITYLKCGAKLPESWQEGKMLEMLMLTD